MDDVVVLIQRKYEKNKYGVQKESQEKRREVFCDVKSANRSEFFAGMQAGIKPDFMLYVHPAEYQGETLAEFRGGLYAIYRSFPKSLDKLELYLQRKVGV